MVICINFTLIVSCQHRKHLQLFRQQWWKTYSDPVVKFIHTKGKRKVNCKWKFHMENPTENIVEVAKNTAKVLFLSFWLISDPFSLLITEASVCKQRVTPLSSGVRASLNYYTGFYKQEHQINLNVCQMINSRGKKRKHFIIHKSVFSFSLMLTGALGEILDYLNICWN